MKVAEWFEAAAAAGDLIAAFNLGLCFSRGIGVEQNERFGAEWLRHAAEGVPEAQYMYARMLQDGRGVTPDLNEARVWFERAAQAGVLDAKVALAEMRLNGRGGAQEPASAVELFREAADAGHAGAMFALGMLHASGENLPLDASAAQRWFDAAAEGGHGPAQLWLERAAGQGVSEADG
jgi:TPR repeat protein